MTRSSALLVILLATPLACDKSQQTTTPSEESTASSEPAPAPAPEPTEEEEAGEDALEDEELWGELTGEGLIERDGESDVEMGETGLIGKGGGGGTGSGYGRGGSGFGGRGQKVPRVSLSKATVDGELDSDIIRRIVRAHINEVRKCYSAGLSKDPELAGKVQIAFTIGADGKVSASEAVDSEDFADQAVVECIAKAAGTWTFPKPGDGGKVQVTYPFNLEPG